MTLISSPAYIGIDQSVGGCGVTVYSPCAREHKTWVKAFPLAKYSGREALQLHALETWLIEIISRFPDRVAAVAREGFAYGAKQGREKAGAVAYAVDSTLLDWLPDPVCYPRIVAPGHLKELATGSGSATKKQVKEGVEKIWGVKCSDDNAADSFVLAQFAYAADGGDTGSPFQKNLLLKVKNVKRRS
ncbi:hypothetical protein [Nonomuraea typhae]|uniref:Holliday junction nuclease RuvC n=1 Tax=Nonomuraea typhae TaxID=2603600 RepID=A0ABW7YJ70_9ACTN